MSQHILLPHEPLPLATQDQHLATTLDEAVRKGVATAEIAARALDALGDMIHPRCDIITMCCISHFERISNPDLETYNFLMHRRILKDIPPPYDVENVTGNSVARLMLLLSGQGGGAAFIKRVSYYLMERAIWTSLNPKNPHPTDKEKEHKIPTDYASYERWAIGMCTAKTHGETDEDDVPVITYENFPGDNNEELMWLLNYARQEKPIHSSRDTRRKIKQNSRKDLLIEKSLFQLYVPEIDPNSNASTVSASLIYYTITKKPMWEIVHALLNQYTDPQKVSQLMLACHWTCEEIYRYLSMEEPSNLKSLKQKSQNVPNNKKRRYAEEAIKQLSTATASLLHVHEKGLKFSEEEASMHASVAAINILISVHTPKQNCPYWYRKHMNVWFIELNQTGDCPLDFFDRQRLNTSMRLCYIQNDNHKKNQSVPFMYTHLEKMPERIWTMEI